ncbi:MAG: hypothetical protein ACSLEL_00205 [Candidatus Malihini olakiniferum]
MARPDSIPGVVISCHGELEARIGFIYAFNLKQASILHWHRLRQ